MKTNQVGRGLRKFLSKAPSHHIMNRHLKSWAAGFIDGEGSFVIEAKRHRDGRCLDVYLRPKLTVQVRDDDEISLRNLQAAFEAAGYFYRRKKRKVSTFGSESKPTVECSWHRMLDLTAVVRMLDAHPPLGRKANDYAIWREAVLVFTDPTLSSRERQHRLVVLREQLISVRTYKQTTDQL